MPSPFRQYASALGDLLMLAAAAGLPTGGRARWRRRLAQRVYYPLAARYDRDVVSTDPDYGAPLASALARLPASFVPQRVLDVATAAPLMAAAKGSIGCLLLTLALFGPAAGMAASPMGTVTGRVVNQTLGRPVADAEVNILVMAEGGPRAVRSVRTDRSGRFRFTGIAPSARATYLLTTDYGGVAYTEGPFPLAAGKPMTVLLAVYDPTTDASVVAIAYRIILIRAVGSDRLSLRDIAGVVSRRPRALRGDSAGTVAVGIPPDASDLRVLRGAAPAGVRDRRLIDTLPVTPRVRDIVVEYTVAYRGRRLLLTWPVDYPTASFDVVVPEDIQVGPGTLSPRGTRAIGGQMMARFAAEALPAGAEVTASLSGLPFNAFPYVWAAAAVAAAAALGWWVVRPVVARGGVPPNGRRMMMP